MRLFLALMLSVFPSCFAVAEVTSSDKNGFVSEHSLVLQAGPARVYRALTAEVAQWWNAEHSFGGQASAFSIDTSAGGCFCETLENGGVVEHMRVVHANPGKLLVLDGGLGPLRMLAVSGSMIFALEAEGEGTRLNYRYLVGGYAPEGLKSMAAPVDAVQLGQLKRLQTYLSKQLAN